MNAPDRVATETWAERNQRWLVQRIAALRRRIEGNGVSADASEVPAEGFTPALLRIALLFGLSAFERDLLLMTAAVELDQAFRHALAQHGGAPRPSFALALSVLDAPHWDALSPQAPLRHWRLISVAAGAPLSEAELRIDERMLHALTGVAAFDERLRGRARLPAVDGAAAPDLTLLPEVAEALAQPPAHPQAPLLVLSAPQVSVAPVAALLRAAGWPTLHLRATDLPHEPLEAAELARLLDREAVLRQAALLVSLDAELPREAGLRLAAWLDEELRCPAVLLGRPSAELRAALARRRVTSLDWPSPPLAARVGLDRLARRIESTTTLADLVLPRAQLAQLREIGQHLRQRERVYQDWGFARRSSRGLGLAALFAGESGTGKTLAAEAIANEAGLDLYAIDLAGVVSKYIGETEKNLGRVFDAAEAGGAVLLFDEADALFGKRSEVKDSHDRYANIEVAYLLQRIEAYRGLAILTTNLKSALDRAFLRRIRFVVQFPFPDEAARGALWRGIWPAQAPLGGLDHRALARLKLSGGNIRSVALNAAFRAADAGVVIDHALVLAAAHAELAKLERPAVGLGHALEHGLGGGA